MSVWAYRGYNGARYWNNNNASNYNNNIGWRPALFTHTTVKATALAARL